VQFQLELLFWGQFSVGHGESFHFRWSMLSGSSSRLKRGMSLWDILGIISCAPFAMP
jgi:hypothetical protein